MEQKLIDILGPQKWGFLRETEEKAAKDGLDYMTGLHRTGLEKYLAVIFPGVDWIHNRMIPRDEVGSIRFKRCLPDYRSVSLKCIVEFDGVPHYTNRSKIEKDKKKDEWYKRVGYKVVRTPYFIQLTNDAVKTLFGVDVKEKLFDVRFPSLGERKGFPSNLCRAGIKRMAKEFSRVPEQYEVNIRALRENRSKCERELNMLEKEYEKILKTTKGVSL